MRDITLLFLCVILDGKYYCNKCALKLYGHENARLTALEKSGTIASTHPHFIKYFLNKDDAEKYSVGSNKKVPLICPDCGTIKNNVTIGSLTYDRFHCLNCSDHISFGEKFFAEFLRQLNIDFQTQLSKTTFKWCKEYKYDFYISSLNFLTEIHGIQHYEETSGNWDSLEEIQENDFDKEWLARENRIDNYIIIDCRFSEMVWIKNSILNSKLSKLFDLSIIDWKKCTEYALKNLIKYACDLWETEIKDTQKIADKLNLHRVTIVRYLNQGKQLGWCDYNGEEESNKNLITMSEKRRKKVICLNTGEVFNSITDASAKFNLKNRSSIVNCLSGKKKSAGKLSNGESAIWEYYDKYLQESAK